jgi:hypothetical protein
MECLGTCNYTICIAQGHSKQHVATSGTSQLRSGTACWLLAGLGFQSTKMLVSIASLHG